MKRCSQRIFSLCKDWHWNVIIVLALIIFVRIGATYMSDPAYFGRSDFAVFYTAAEFTISGDQLNTQKFADAVIANRGASGAVRYLYPPVAVLLFIPFTVVSFDTAVWIWLAINIAATVSILITVQYLLKIKQKYVSRYWLYSLAVMVVFTPMYLNLRTGQVNSILTLLFLLFIFYVQRKKTVLPIVVLGLITAVKMFPFIIIIPHLFKKKFTLAGIALVFASLLTLIAMPLVSFGNQKPMIQSLFHTVNGIHQQGLHRYDNPTLNGVLYRSVEIKNAGLFNVQDDKTFKEAADKLDKRLQKTNINVKQKQVNWIPSTHLSIVLILFGLLLVFSYLYRASDEILIHSSLWLSFVFLAAKDAHIEYFIFLLPSIIFLLSRSLVGREKIKDLLILVLSILLLSVAWLRPFPFVSLPPVLTWLPLAFLGNVLIMYVYINYLRTHRRLHGSNNNSSEVITTDAG